MTAAKKILEDALALSEAERSELIAALSDSLDPSEVELGAGGSAEIEARIARIESGEEQPLAWSEVEDRIQRMLDRK